MQPTPHTFHIPVMGLAYTIDSPIKVARFGISSVISIIEDRLVESMRRHYYKELQEHFIPITTKEADYRAKRITDYLNLVNRIVQQQVEKLKNEAFEKDSEIVQYFEMLPSDHALRKIYQLFTNTNDIDEKQKLEKLLRDHIKPGSIDVNIMTKVDRESKDKNGTLREDGSDAVAAFRGYVKSNLTNSSVIFSAGLNPRLYNYLEKFTELDAKAWGEFDKKVVIKVSDYRSAFIQGKYLAKKGIWVSEFRIESGLNCGGHAFATDGFLLGPILEEFKNKKAELTDTMHQLYTASLTAQQKAIFDKPHPVKISVQGGIGTHEEDLFLREHYSIDATGWGSPFLLVPEATTVDDETLQLLCQADENAIMLSKNSPLGVRFNYLKGTTSEKEKINRITLGRPGSPCTEKHLATNTEFTTEPICTASREYQQKKIIQLKSANLSSQDLEKQIQAILDKECLCVGLSNAASLKYEVPFLKRLKAVNICPGPNIAYFSKVVSLRDMVDHIYGRKTIIQVSERPHMFIKEIGLYLDYLREQLQELREKPDAKRIKYFEDFSKNLAEGIQYYKRLKEDLFDHAESLQQKFGQSLSDAEEMLHKILEELSLNKQASAVLL
ncbi:MAG: hypothetical protein JNM57_00310 [Cyclobacteriaceae bacterium]|nr:hypothetical protein [Cyclobacteriaceae bacterium]